MSKLLPIILLAILVITIISCTEPETHEAPENVIIWQKDPNSMRRFYDIAAYWAEQKGDYETAHALRHYNDSH